MSENIEDEIKRLQEELAKKQEELDKIQEEKRLEEEAELKRIEEERRKKQEKERQKRKENYLSSHSNDVRTDRMSVSAKLDNLPVITTSEYCECDLKDLKEKLEKMPDDKKMVLAFTANGMHIDFENASNCEFLNPSIIKIHKRGNEISFEMQGGEVEFADNTHVADNSIGGLDVCSASYFAEKQNNNKKAIDRNGAIMGRLKERFIGQSEKGVSADVQMNRGALYPLDMESMPELLLRGYLSVKLDRYKEDIASLKSGEKLTFGRKGGEPVKGEKCVSVFGASDKVSRKHVSVVNVDGKLFLQDMSLNGTKMRTPIKRDNFAKDLEMISASKAKDMDKGALYPLDLETMPDLYLCGQFNLKLDKYKEGIASLKPGERLTFGREGGEPENGEKCVALEGVSGKVSRKHVSVVNIDGKLFLQDMSLNGTKMQTQTKDIKTAYKDN